MFNTSTNLCFLTITDFGNTTQRMMTITFLLYLVSISCKLQNICNKYSTSIT